MARRITTDDGRAALAEVAAATATGAQPPRQAHATAVRYLLELLAEKAPGNSVEVRVPLTFVAVLLALALTGYLAAWIGGARRGRSILRTVIGGALALGATYGVGALFGVATG